MSVSHIALIKAYDEGKPTLVVRPKFVPNALRQLEQWHIDVHAFSRESREISYLSFLQIQLPPITIAMLNNVS
jgi:hypothetical protein